MGCLEQFPSLSFKQRSDSVRKEIFGDPTLKYTSSTRPTGRACMEEDGFRISGRWSLVSGCMHADWIGFMCLVEKEGEIQMAEQGGPQMQLDGFKFSLPVQFQNFFLDSPGQLNRAYHTRL